MTVDRSPAGDDDLYAALGVPSGASDEDITRAYRRQAREHHPDANPAARAHAFSDLTDAYDVLHDPERRRAYDRTRRARTEAADAAAGLRIPVRHVTPPRQTPPTGGPGAADTRVTAAPREVELAVTFDQAALGATAVVPVEVEFACRSCGGAATAATNPGRCPDCAGTGVTTRKSGGITIRRECPGCDGNGRLPAVPCPDCEGTGRQRATREMKVRVPAGVEDGTRLRIPVAEHGPGLVAVVRTATTHPYFSRRGHDLMLRLPVTIAEAALGGVVTVPTLTGAVAIRIPPGTPNGRTMRIRGRGIPHLERPGDLLVTVDVVVPDELNDAQRAALEAFAAATTRSPRSHFETPSTNDTTP